MSKPFLTIGIASYNYARYLDKALAQIKRQDFKDIEIIYSDDGSTDDSVDKIKEFIEREKCMNIRLIQGKHEGILANRNRIIDSASGEYLMICDADDYMLDDCLKVLCGEAKRTEADCIIGGFVEISDNGKIYKQHVPTVNASKWLYTWHHGQIYRTNIVKKNQIRFEAIPDDVYYLQKVHQNSNKVCFVRQVVYAWCRHATSTSAVYNQNIDWHPVKLWNDISTFTVELIKHQQKEEDIQNLTYYLYKWYYFNITDLYKEDRKCIRRNIGIMQRKMKDVNPDYRKCSMLKKALQSGDTSFAKVAVSICWTMENMHLLIVVVMIRRLQTMLRR
jgi:glycosyltransferase involved in cell wall biosynthesis